MSWGEGVDFGLGTKKMAKQLTILAALLENQNSVPNTHIWWFTTGDPTPSSGLHGYRKIKNLKKNDLGFKTSTTVIPALRRQRQEDHKFKAMNFT